MHMSVLIAPDFYSRTSCCVGTVTVFREATWHETTKKDYAIEFSNQNNQEPSAPIVHNRRQERTAAFGAQQVVLCFDTSFYEWCCFIANVCEGPHFCIDLSKKPSHMTIVTGAKKHTTSRVATYTRLGHIVSQGHSVKFGTNVRATSAPVRAARGQRPFGY